ncbi:IPT/TIG domain-containing protein [Bacteroidales bacterium OttesenSCG-928-A17]|nr:IPT/TIG domain-containing protein [Bacteroidales bacterium OttesenSCG-928-A17]
MNNKYIATLSKLCLLIASCALLFTACDNDDLDTNQFGGSGVTLKAFGPSPIARGGELRIMGNNVINVVAVEIPGVDEITDIKKDYGSNEIRVTVPQTAEPGLISIITPNGKITSLTKLTFSEPISVDDFSPKSAKAGDIITITGDYLNLIKEVIFAEDVHVREFVSQSRNEIKLILPAEAQTGLFILSDGADIVPDPVEGEEPLEPGIPIQIYTEEELNVTLPAVATVAKLEGVKPGQTIPVAGTNLDLVKSILLANENTVEFTLGEDGISFVLPEDVTDGIVYMIPASGVKVEMLELVIAIPEDVTLNPNENVKAGDLLTFTGKNMELVTNITFPGVEEAAVLVSVSATEVTVLFPEAATSGDLILNLGSGKEVSVAISTLKPVVTAFNPNPAFAGSEVTVNGTNLDLVASIIFGGDLKVEVVNPTAESFTVSVPTLANSGDVTLVMKNGETVDAGNLTVDKPVACYISIFPDEETEIQAGNLLTVGVENADKLTDVQVKGKSTQFILQGNTLFIAIPVNAFGKEVPVTLISSNGQVEYTFNVTPAGFVENTLWSGILGPIAWDENARIPWSYFEGKVEGGSTIRVHYTATEGGQVEIMGYWWTGLEGPKEIFVDGDGRAIIPVEAGSAYLEFKLTAGDVDLLKNQGGMQFCGNDVTISKVSVVEGGVPDVVAWEGEFDLGAWANNWEVPCSYFEPSDIKVGTVITFHFEAYDDWWQFKINDGNWGGDYGYLSGGYTHDADIAENNTTFDIVVDKDILGWINGEKVAAAGWGSAVIINGENVKFTKITYVP